MRTETSTTRTCGLLVALAGVMLLGCKAKEGKDAGFVMDPQRMVHDENVPFHKVWKSPDFDPKRYKKIYVAPVHTDHLMKMKWWDHASIGAVDRKNMVERLAKFYRNEVQEQFREDPTHAVEIVDEPSGDVMVLELALTEFAPTKAVLNAAGYYFAMAFDHGLLAMEGRVRDGGTGELLVMFKDRETGKIAIATLADLTWDLHAKHIMEDWAEEFVQLYHAAPGEEVKDSPWFTLKPW